MGGGVFAYANASLAQVAGGFFQFETVGTNPYGQRLVSMGGVCGDHDGFVSALGRAGKMGLIRASDLNPSSIEKPEEYLEYVAAHEGECFIPVYDIDEQTIIDEHPVTFVVL